MLPLASSTRPLTWSLFMRNSSAETVAGSRREADVCTVSGGAFPVCRRPQAEGVGLFPASAEGGVPAANRACEMTAAQVHQEGTEPGRAGRVDALLAGRAAAHAEHAADAVEQVRPGRTLVFLDLEIRDLEALGAQHAAQRMADGRVGRKGGLHGDDGFTHIRGRLCV